VIGRDSSSWAACDAESIGWLRPEADNGTREEDTSKVMNLKTITIASILLGQASLLRTASAVCLDRTTFVSGYKIPLVSEVRAADGIVIGRVLSEQGLREDPTDPDGYTAFNVVIKVVARLKGNLPNVIVVRNENTSARYPMSIGEEHLLFVSKNGQGLWVNSCGNSSAMPEAKQQLVKIRAQLLKLK
jgi:hypothetical protein